MKKNIIITIIIFFCAGSACIAKEEKAFTPDTVFSKANESYEKGDWGNAIEENSSILEQGLESANLFYNLGNCYLKKGDIGMAVLNYERARMIIPRDSDLLFNYRFAKSSMKQQDVVASWNIFEKSLINIFRYLTLKENIYFGVSLYYLIVILVVVSLFKQGFRPYSILFIMIFFLTLVVQYWPIKHKAREKDRGAVVLAEIMDARYEPFKDADVHFPLYAGMKVYILREREDWQRVQRPDGKIGWVEKGMVELVCS